jgi:signal transduction histidine kinase
MLHYSKHRDPEYKIANLNSVLQDVIDLLEEKAAQRNISFILNFDEDLNKMEFDPQGIYRCVLNLVSNSIDALENIPNGKIEIVSQKSKNQAVIKVKDNGCGMDRITQEQLFSKFFSTKGSKGTGLGLPVTKKIIEEHGGSLILESQKNAGTTFSIKIPLQKNK